MLRPFFSVIALAGLASAVFAQGVFQFVSVETETLGSYLQISWTTSLPSTASASCDITQGNRTQSIVFDGAPVFTYDHSVTIAVASGAHYACLITATDQAGQGISELVKDTGKRQKL